MRLHKRTQKWVANNVDRGSEGSAAPVPDCSCMTRSMEASTAAVVSQDWGAVEAGAAILVDSPEPPISSWTTCWNPVSGDPSEETAWTGNQGSNRRYVSIVTCSVMIRRLLGVRFLGIRPGQRRRQPRQRRGRCIQVLIEFGRLAPGTLKMTGEGR